VKVSAGVESLVASLRDAEIIAVGYPALKALG
jgi:hypothetical protein